MSNQLIAALPGAVFGLIGVIVSTAAAIYAGNVRRQSQLGLIGPRLQAYRKLWKHMEIAAPSRRMQDPMLKVTDDENSVKQQLTEMELATLNNELRSWYYSEGEGGYGIFLSNDTAALYRQAVKSVLSAVPNDAQATRNVVDKLSTLRSWTKNEIAVFGRWEY